MAGEDLGLAMRHEHFTWVHGGAVVGRESEGAEEAVTIATARLTGTETKLGHI
jgi:hypothetical protein